MAEIKKYLPSIIILLVERGIDMSGYQNVVLAYILWAVSGVLLIWASWSYIIKLAKFSRGHLMYIPGIILIVIGIAWIIVVYKNSVPLPKEEKPKVLAESKKQESALEESKELPAPELLIKSLVPVMIYEKKEVDFSDAKFKYMDQGISFVIHVETKSRPITVSRLKVKGKIFIPPNMYLMAEGKTGSNIKKIYQEWEERKPYINADFTAYLDTTKSNESLSAFTDKRLLFTLIDPIARGQAESGWTVPFSDYLGYSDGSKKPTKLRTYPEFDFIFKKIGKGLHFDICDEIKNGDLKFVLEAGTKEYPIPFEYFKKRKLFTRKYWNKNPIEKLIPRDQ